MDLLKAMTVFVRVVETGSLTAAATACDLSPTMVGNHLQALETRLGARLIHRTTRRQKISTFGQAYYERCVEILGLIDDSERLALDHLATPRGRLRVTAPVVFSNECLIPGIADYCERYPEVKLDIVVTDALSDLMGDGFEAAVRIGALGNPDLVARRLRPYRLVLCASRAYLATHGTPSSPDALRSHQCLTYAYPPRSEWHATQPEWILHGPEGHVSVPVDGRLKIDNSEALRRAALRGLGIAMLPAMLVAGDLRAKRLIEVLPDFSPPERPLNLLYLRERQMSPKLRSFIDFVVERFGADTSAHDGD
ncbi:LysR family transcriptional regulator [Paraburkholderia lycopersici]|uniref:DNA-binding transcriptional regulator, LysR family n=1 Tax=Paraburkholderia lycopersici TaxID=416944 RepID=A0A1G6PCA4_9BURK|nr:LysR family transcriptional regulator [Paraburkholderia lycopersici]SDC77872.1 DNA-binding transcriptional regulator, LysR family [Paraburkholderia lycopersici]